ncbi:MAG: hypothetical protein OZ913_05355 [Ignavibacteriaceae bacterium]|jgi:hypothetical protein|nr:MAG: hypothetical protein EDM69_02305 [Chlorobiota bacterium]KXK02424.1 MAG: hypothetical protein UZ04_CHB001001717 [Chlorobi bacterium OLB4]MBV6398022.1 hypothetical protein [Ignavibacteria bacterium]MCC6886470.1 hypothetical protein [Ignavibacteriales bacterium]MCE7952455.1 hypothetical protein [Chlorobi bacterium CHB7]MDL1886571.1 hypothetical protein [Ignavibacteria bacterium CHB1]MEB2329711.1 hypothetical protein [Ignavibacteriaceae bacterium]OQY77328.1 MAG: hypothetical protein B6D4
MKKYSGILIGFFILLNLLLSGAVYFLYKGYEKYKTLADYKSEKFDKLATNFNSVRDRNIELVEKLDELTDKTETLERHNRYLTTQNRKLQNTTSSLLAYKNRYKRIYSAGNKTKKYNKKFKTKRKKCNNYSGRNKYSKRYHSGKKYKHTTKRYTHKTGYKISRNRNR